MFWSKLDKSCPAGPARGKFNFPLELIEGSDCDVESILKIIAVHDLPQFNAIAVEFDAAATFNGGFIAHLL